MDPEFTRIMIRVAIVGGTMGVIGAAAVFFALRAFRGREFRANVIVAALLAFLLLCCVILLRLSIIR